MKESDIRPQELLARYVELSAQDAHRCFGDERRYDMACVAYGGTESEPQFIKTGFGYSQCCQCGTLYQTPRSSIEAFESFYRNSESSNTGRKYSSRRLPRPGVRKSSGPGWQGFVSGARNGVCLCTAWLMLELDMALCSMSGVVVIL